MKSLLFAALLLLSYNVFSQVSKGAILVGGSLNVNYSKSEDDEKPGPSWAWYKQSSFTTRISPSIGFFTSDTWMTGFGLTYDYNSTSSENGIPLGNGGWVKNSSKTKSHFYSANAFVRKYINLKEKLFLTMNFSVEGGMGISKQELESFDAGGDLKTNSYYTSLVVTPGLTYFISNKWAVTSTIGILQTTFQWRKSDDDNSAPDNFSANTNLSVRANTFSVGLQYFFYGMERSKLNISWNSDFYQSKENCTVKFYDHENVIASHITGKYDNVQYSANYKIRTTPDWKTIAVEISYTLNNSSYTLEAIHAESQWIVNGIVREEFKNCTDIDITVTPCTNTLPINRLDLQLNNPQQIEVFYINVLENSIYPVRQQYTKKSGTLYNFQNVPNDFEADIIVDTDGFVVHYPELFER